MYIQHIEIHTLHYAISAQFNLFDSITDCTTGKSFTQFMVQIENCILIFCIAF